jgi:hypothetical protein
MSDDRRERLQKRISGYIQENYNMRLNKAQREAITAELVEGILEGSIVTSRQIYQGIEDQFGLTSKALKAQRELRNRALSVIRERLCMCYSRIPAEKKNDLERALQDEVLSGALPISEISHRIKDELGQTDAEFYAQRRRDLGIPAGGKINHEGRTVNLVELNPRRRVCRCCKEPIERDIPVVVVKTTSSNGNSSSRYFHHTGGCGYHYPVAKRVPGSYGFRER